MKKYVSLKLIFCVFLVTGIVAVNGCASTKTGSRSSYVDEYKTATRESAVEAVVLDSASFNRDWVKSKIEYALGDLKADGLSQRIIETYADDLYFNDTLHTYTRAIDLAEYMEDMAGRVSVINIEFDDVTVSDKDAYVRWSMMFQTDEGSEPINSVGMSHLRFNAQGEIILHQDYWDGVEGLFRTVPVLGLMLKSVKRFL